MSFPQPKEYLDKADEIKVSWSNINYIPELKKTYSHTRILLKMEANHPYLDGPDWEYVEMLNRMCGDAFWFEVLSDDQVEYCAKKNINCLLSGAFSSFYELLRATKLGVKQVRIAPPLTHYLHCFETLPIEVRVTANEAWTIPGKDWDGLKGGWFRPEDLYQEEAIDICEFHSDGDDTRERALYRIYAEKHEWPGQLGLIIHNLGSINIVNRLIPDNLHMRRRACGQKCFTGSACHLCEQYAEIATEEFANKVKEIVKKVEI